MLAEYRFDYSKVRPNRFAAAKESLRTPSTARAKGNLVEDLVALLHEDLGTRVERRVRLQSLTHGPKRQREIDVLLTADIAGYPMRIAIECKNERRPVGTERIDQFIGKLEDIGIPTNQGIFVSPTRYTSAGLQRALAAGIRPLLLEGLTADRLRVELSDALQSIVYLSATWRQISRFDNVGDAGFNAPWFSVRTNLPKDLGNGLPAVLTHLWLLWMRDEIQPRIGIHHIYIRVPEGFRYSRGETPVADSHLIVDLEVVGYVASIAGKAKRLGLRHAESSLVEKLRVEAEIKTLTKKIQLDRFETEEALDGFLTSHTIVMQQRLRVPRLISDRFYWPPTMDAIERVQQLKASGEEITFEKVEGSSLWRAWNFTFPDTAYRDHT